MLGDTNFGKQVLKQVRIGAAVALLGAIGMGGAGCRKAVQYGSTDTSSNPAPVANQTQEFQTYLEVNYGALGKDKRSLHAVSKEGNVYELDAPIILPTSVLGPASILLNSNALSSLGTLRGASLSSRLKVETIEARSSSSSQASWAVEGQCLSSFRDQLKLTTDSDPRDSALTLTVEGENGKLEVRIPVRNTPESPKIQMEYRYVSADQAVTLSDGTRVIALADLKIDNSSQRDLDLHLERKVSGTLLKGYSRTVLSQGNCAIASATDSEISSLSSNLILLASDESIATLTSVAKQAMPAQIQRKIPAGSTWEGTVYAVRPDSFGKSFAPGQCSVAPPKFLSPTCQNGKCKLLHIELPMGRSDDIDCDQDGYTIPRSPGGFRTPCTASRPGVACIEFWPAPAPAIPVYDTVNDLGLGLALSPNWVSGQVTYSDIAYESPHQSTDLAVQATNDSLVGSIPFDAPVVDIPADCPLN